MVKLPLKNLLGKILDAGQSGEPRSRRSTTNKMWLVSSIRTDVALLYSPVLGLDENLHQASLTVVESLVKLFKLGDVEAVGNEEFARPFASVRRLMDKSVKYTTRRRDRKRRTRRSSA